MRSTGTRLAMVNASGEREHEAAARAGPGHEGLNQAGHEERITVRVARSATGGRGERIGSDGRIDAHVAELHQPRVAAGILHLQGVQDE